MDISWEHAQTFLSVAEQQSFSGAARVLGVGQPTVSRRIASLEEQLGRPLFWRGKQGARLTEDGSRLMPAAAQMARWAGELERLAAGADEALEGVVRLAAPPGLAVDLLAPFAAIARRELPGIRLEVLASVEYIDLSRGAVDLAIRSRAPSEPELVALYSGEQALGVFASPAYAASLPPHPAPADVDWITWAFPYENVAPRPLLERLIEGFAPAFASDSYLVQKGALLHGLGAMILEREPNPLAPAADRVEIDLGLDLPPATYHLVCARSMRFVPRVRAVADLLVAKLVS